ncbi:MAG: hypothetical protein R3F14_03860 [Polyangiaceae bacterium]
MIEVVLAPGVKLRLTVGPAATEEADSALPVVDVSAVPGARVVMRRGFTMPEAHVRAACVTAPADRWAPGIEELVLGRATGLAIGGLGAKIDRWEPGAIRAEGGRFEQTLTGRAGEREAAWIRHELVFVGSDHDALLCSVGCEGAACREVVSSVAIEGTLVGPPPPSLLVQAVLWGSGAALSGGGRRGN